MRWGYRFGSVRAAVGWRHAWLISTAGIRSQPEQEKRATSCLLAVMHGVPEFGHALLKPLGAPRAPVIETFAEVRLKDATDKTVEWSVAERRRFRSPAPLPRLDRLESAALFLGDYGDPEARHELDHVMARPVREQNRETQAVAI